MGFGFKVEIWGDYACFSRPELKVERVSYDCMTPSAARGILESVFWKPAIRYVIDEIAVCNRISFENLRRNEVGFKANNLTHKVATEHRQQRATLLLRNVRYTVCAHFEMTDAAGDDDCEGKFVDIIHRRLKKGQHFHQPYLGTREFPANLRLISDEEAGPASIDESRLLGLMFYDMDYEYTTNKQDEQVVKEFKPTYFLAEMESGVIDLRNVEVLR